ncbi:cysteine--tRNA ligase [Candidatus Marinamargulisbacteria bacterium SCGC AG-439-L15]|nr:cysteine--tRNA ligase [Candidatus Marinamargulisbacteria bacterium SCGC AG-439-L15]
MTLYLYNTLSRQKETFKPIEDGKVRMYVCGVTVYDYCHIGHARAYIVFDILKRVLEYLGYDVTHIQNFTDIDDKIITRANETDKDTNTLTETFIDAYFEDMSQLNIKKATRYPKATNFISDIITMIQTLIQKGIAYEHNGEVLFSVTQKEDYGKLSHKILEDLVSGSRVEVSEHKKNPLDFVLWKPSKPNEPSWDSPWGKGRPGWHIECSAMAKSELGDTIDIHGGGEDLIFPHHENEIAQSECANDRSFANYWIHNGFVTIKDEKMSKSKQNFFTLREVLTQYDGETLRFFLQRVHYRSPLNFSTEGLEDAKQALQRFHTTLNNTPKNIPFPKEITPQYETIKTAFIAALCDDLNLSEALAHLVELSKLINTHQAGVEHLKELGNIIGLFESNQAPLAVPDHITDLAKERLTAKKNKDYQLADEIRNKITAEGYTIEDTPDSFRVIKTK